MKVELIQINLIGEGLPLKINNVGARVETVPKKRQLLQRRIPLERKSNLWLTTNISLEQQTVELQLLHTKFNGTKAQKFSLGSILKKE